MRYIFLIDLQIPIKVAFYITKVYGKQEEE